MANQVQRDDDAFARERHCLTACTSEVARVAGLVWCVWLGGGVPGSWSDRGVLRRRTGSCRGVKQRSILALLIANRGHTVSADRIVDEVYGEDAAAGARRSVQTIVSMLRRDLGDVIVGTGDGYRFDAARDTVDVCRFEDTVAAGLGLVGDDPRQASSIFDEALGLWRDDPYGDVDGRGVFQTEIARLSELRFTALTRGLKLIWCVGGTVRWWRSLRRWWGSIRCVSVCGVG